MVLIKIILKGSSEMNFLFYLKTTLEHYNIFFVLFENNFQLENYFCNNTLSL